MSWSWESISQSLAAKPLEMLSVLNRRMKSLENYLLLSETTRTPYDKVTTTDATPKTLKTIPVQVDRTTLISGYVVARRTGGSAGAANDGAAYRLEVVATNTAGTAAEIAAETLGVIGESQAGWTVTSSASGGNIIIQVTGAANNTVAWVWSGWTLGVST